MKIVRLLIILMMLLGLMVFGWSCGGSDNGDEGTTTISSRNDDNAGDENADEAAAGDLVDVNTADKEELADLPGISSTTAGRIIAYREENGDFSDIEELNDVRGIGDATMAKIRELVTVGDADEGNAGDDDADAEMADADVDAEEAAAGQLNVNRASAEALEALPGIGPSTAQKIIDYREENGDFASVDDLVNVPRIGPATLNKFRDMICVEGGVRVLAEAAASSSSSAADDAEESSSASGNPVNINTAGPAELTTLNGIGPSTAQKIIAYREENGDFASVDDLVNVRGIGEATLAKFRDDVTVD